MPTKVSSLPRVEVTPGLSGKVRVFPDGVALVPGGQAAQELTYILDTGTPSADLLRILAHAKKFRLSMNNGALDSDNPATGEEVILEYDATTNQILLTPTLLGANSASPFYSSEMVFTETAGAGVYTGSVALPAGATLRDVLCRSTALWTAPALLDVGDGSLSDGWLTNINLTATSGQRACDLPVNNEINFMNVPAAKAGVWIANSALRKGVYSDSARSVVARIQTTGAVGATGVTRIIVYYTVGTPVAATKTTV